ncbi:MAG: RNA polymerase sigma factor [Nitrospira sp.]|nr:RNA polymerase sigma factor [Nitrospira sp.]MBH0205064.1 RNA polymerase sigma factor [Nitrospira sp.]
MRGEGRTSGILQRLLENESAFRQFVRRRVGDEVVAEDILQQSLIRAVERHHSLRNDESAVAWFYRILRHALVDYYRSRGAEVRRNEAFLQELTVSGSLLEPPLDEVKETVCACLHRLLPGLRGNYADLIKRIDLDGESPAQVAKELKISQNNLTVRLHRARQSLRASLEGACGICSKHGCLNCTCG